MNRYRAGRDFEHEVRNRLRDDGYTVFRMAGSKTSVDLIAVKPGQLVFCQAKRSGRETRTERLNLLRITKCLPGSLAIVADRDGPRGKAMRFWQLTGPNPKERQWWYSDETEAAS